MKHSTPNESNKTCQRKKIFISEIGVISKPKREIVQIKV